jgi:prepilin-type N-terminal cleavage/methylation domain-containing protein
METTPSPRNTAGFTLLELITVLGVIAVLSGIGIGFLSKSENDLEIAIAVVRDKIRLAHETARNTGRPTSVELFQRHDAETQELVGQYLSAKVLATVGQWHLEPGERAFAGLDPELIGYPEKNGRYGHGMRPDPEKGGTMFAIHTKGEARFNMRHGFAFKIELFLESREKCVVAQLGPTFVLELDEDLAPIASMFLADPGSRRGPQVRIDTQDSELPLRRWVSVELVHDGRVFRLLVDGEEVGSKSAMGESFQDRQGNLFEVSPDGSVPGIIDEIQLLAYHSDEQAELPALVEIKGLEKPIDYDRRGKLTRPVTLEFTLGDQKLKKSVAPGGVLQ